MITINENLFSELKRLSSQTFPLHDHGFFDQMLLRPLYDDAVVVVHYDTPPQFGWYVPHKLRRVDVND